VRQLERSDCGPAALLGVLRHWGGDASLPEVRALCRTDAGGSTFLRLAEAATALGFVARGVRGEIEDLRRERMPCIAHVITTEGLPHFVVVRGVRCGWVRIADPAMGRRRLRRASFERIWVSRSALLLTPTPRLRRRLHVGWMRWLAGYLERDTAWLTQCVFLAAATTAIGLLTAVFVRWTVDRFIPDYDVGMVTATGALLAGLFVFRAAASHLRHRFLLRLVRGVASTMNGDLLARLYRLPRSYFECRAIGEVTSRFADAMRAQRSAVSLVGAVVIDGLIAFGSIALVALVAPPLAAIASAGIPLYLVVLALSMVRLPPLIAQARAAHASSEAASIDALRGIAVLQAFGRAADFEWANRRLFDTSMARSERLGLAHAEIALLAELTVSALIVGAVTWGSLLVISGDLMLGQFIAGYALISGAAPSMDRLVHALVDFQDAKVGARRAQDILLTPDDHPSGTLPAAIRRGLALDAVDLEWPNGAPLLAGLSLELPLGRVTGLRGRSGSGKSTVVSLLLRSREPTGGRILADGVQVGRLALDDYRRSVALFSSETYLFATTLADNVLLGLSAEEREGGIHRLDSLGFHDFQHRFSEGWTTLVGESGRALSSGERQVVGLMRALVGRPSVLLVDEGVVGTDTELTELMLRVILGYGRDHAVLLVSHDPRILARTDHLAILAAGRIEVEGSPADVLV
jgi:ATP-binding cassette subfamily B protein